MAQPLKQSPPQISQGMLTSDGVVLADAFAQKTDIASGTITPFDGDLDLSGGVGGGTSSEISRIYYAAENGLDPGNSGAANSAALQTLINTVNAAGGGLIRVGVGTFDLAVVGNDPHNAAFGYCVELKSNVHIRGVDREATVFKLADNQHTDARYANMFVGGGGVTNFGLQDMRITCNTANQPGYTGGYHQAGFGSPVYIGNTNTLSGTHSYFNLIDITLDDCFSGPVQSFGGDNIVWDGIYADNCGEGPQINWCSDSKLKRIYYRNTNEVAVGDGIEIANCSNVDLDNFLVQGCSNGSGLDCSGIGMRISNGRVVDTVQGGSIQNFSASPFDPCSDDVYVENVFMEVSGDGWGLLGSLEGGPSRITMSNCHVVGVPSVLNSRGFLISPQTGSPSERWADADIKLFGCSATGMQVGLSINRTETVYVKNMLIADSYVSGVLVNAGNALAGSEEGQTVVYIEADIYNSTEWGFGDVNTATAPVGYIKGHFEGNYPGLTGYLAGAQGYTYFQDSPTWKTINTRESRPDWPTGQASASICGEKEVVCTHTSLTQLLNGYHGQVTRVVFDATCAVASQSDNTGGNIDLSTNRIEASNTFNKYDSLTLRYAGGVEAWKEIQREQGVLNSVYVPPIQYWQFDGADDFATLGTNLLGSAQPAFTFAAWVKNCNNNAFIVSEWPWFGIQWTGDKPMFYTYNDSVSNYHTVRPTDEVFVSSFAHIAFTFDAGVSKWYVDGLEVATTSAVAAPATMNALNAEFKVGAGGTAFAGGIRDLRIYNVVKNATQILSIRNGGGEVTGRLASYQCLETSGTTGVDDSGNGKDLTLTNITEGTFFAVE